jgi:hypothetical protein
MQDPCITVSVYPCLRHKIDLRTPKTECTVDSTSDYTFSTLYRSYFKSISANIELQVYSETSCTPYANLAIGKEGTLKLDLLTRK